MTEENSPADCFRRRGNERSEAIGAAAPGQNSLLSARETIPQGMVFYFMARDSNKEGGA